jgi:hypothetical protein
MKDNIFLTAMPELHEGFINRILKIPHILIERNFEQVLGKVIHSEVNKICILMDVWNVSGKKFNYARGQYAAEQIHKVDSIIPILIWDGREYNCPDKDIPEIFQMYGKILPVKFPNQLYLMPKNYKSGQIAITVKFFKGELTLKDVPKKECLSLNFLNA